MDNELEQFIEKHRSLVLTTYEQAKAHTNIIIGGGYVGLFAIWNFTRESLLHWQTVSVGLALVISVMSYVLFSVYSVWLQSTQTFSLLKQLKEAEELERFPSKFGAEEQRRIDRLAKIWPIFFTVTLLFTILGASLLVGSFIQQLISPQSNAL